MSKQFLLVNAPVVLTPAQSRPVQAQIPQPSPLWLTTSAILLLALMALVMFYQLKLEKLEKKLKFEQFRSRELQKKLKLALQTLHKIETNPDLINSREINLDYIRMRMAEEVFHSAIVHQIKVKVKDKISQALRPSQAQQGFVGVSSTGRQIDEIFDVEYEHPGSTEHNKCVLFRVQIRLIKLPTQTTSTTVNQIIDCIQIYLSSAEDDNNWQPTIQGTMVLMHWDQKAKPTPMLVIEQSNEGVNVSFATKRQQIASTVPSSN